MISSAAGAHCRDIDILCWRFYHAALPKLYADVTIDIGGGMGEVAVEAFASARNQGLVHMRTLTLTSSYPMTKTEYSGRLFRMIVDALPRGTLKQLEKLWIELKLSNCGPALIDLRIKCPQLKTAVILDDDTVEDWVPILCRRICPLEKCQALSITIGAKWDPKWLILSAQKAENLRTLELRFGNALKTSFSRFCMGIFVNRSYWQSSSEWLSPHSSSRQAPCLQTLKISPLLQTLSLHSSDFTVANPSDATQDYPRMMLNGLNFDVLTVLVLQDCTSCGTMLRALADDGKRLALRTLTAIATYRSETTPTDDMPFVEAVNRLLQRFKGLRNLAICGRLRYLPQMSAVLNHSSTLQAIHLESTFPVSRYQMAEIGTLCENCQELQQISLAFPKVRVGVPVPYELFDFEDETRRLVTSLNHLAKLRKLTTMRILDPPQVRPPANSPRDNRRIDVSDKARTLACEMFCLLAHLGLQSLNVVAFGSGGQTHRQGDPTMHCFHKEYERVAGDTVTAIAVKSTRRSARLEGRFPAYLISSESDMDFCSLGTSLEFHVAGAGTLNSMR